jgi:hypothetical protein
MCDREVLGGCLLVAHLVGGEGRGGGGGTQSPRMYRFKVLGTGGSDLVSTYAVSKGSRSRCCNSVCWLEMLFV